MASRGARCARARGGQRDVEYLEGTRIERSRRAINIHDLYIVSSRAARVRDSFARGCVHTRACVHARVRYSRLPKLQRSSRRKRSLLSSCFSTPPLSLPPHPLSLSLSFHIRPLFKRNGGRGGEGGNGGICIHTTSHTVRFNISDHGWKLSPETQVDTRGTTGPDERRHTRDCRLFPLLLDVNGASAFKCDHH